MRRRSDDNAPRVFEDRESAGDWRVEYGDDNGARYVTIFSGPMARARAHAYHGALVNRILATIRAS